MRNSETVKAKPFIKRAIDTHPLISKSEESDAAAALYVWILGTLGSIDDELSISQRSANYFVEQLMGLITDKNPLSSPPEIRQYLMTVRNGIYASAQIN